MAEVLKEWPSVCFAVSVGIIVMYVTLWAMRYVPWIPQLVWMDGGLHFVYG